MSSLNRSTRLPPKPSRRPISAPWLSCLIALILCSIALPESLSAQRVRVATRAGALSDHERETSSGEVPGSQPLHLIVRLGPSAAQATELSSLLSAQTSPGSSEYHKWLTPEQFHQRFGWTNAERRSLIDWFAANGLYLALGTSTNSRISLQASASQAEHAFSVALRSRPNLKQNLSFSPDGEATLPAAFAAHIQSVSGLDNLPELSAGRLLTPAPALSEERSGSVANPSVSREAPRAEVVSELLASLEDAVAENALPVLVLDSTLCAAQLSTAERTDFQRALQQAQAQGITVLVEGTCTAAQGQPEDKAFPSALAETSAVTSSTAGVAVPTLPAGAEQRPTWQAATGLPSDGLRHAPDFAVSSVSALQSTVLSLVKETGGRIGSLSPTLYALQKTPGLFERAETLTNSSTAPADWTQADGLGTLNLETLLRVYPHGIVATTTNLVSSVYTVGYGDAFNLTATVLPSSYGTANPTGTVTFTSSTQGVLGSATINSGGSATLTPDVLPVGSYTVVATYSGDGSYGSSVSTSKVQITVSSVNAKVTATITPAASVPYGATATVTTTVALPGANAAPSGLVTAEIEGVTGASFSAVLSPNAGGNTATANIAVSVPPPGTTYTLQVSCQGSANYQCQTPVILPLSTSKGYTNTSVSVTPAAPQAGQSISLTATVADAGNGTGAYTFSGSVSFYDSGKLIATAPLGTNQATAMLTLSGKRTHNIVAIYSGDANWTTSTSGAAAVAPTILPDSLTISSNVSSGVSLSGVNVIFNAVASSTITYGVGPTGTVTFYDTFNNAVVALGNPAAVVANGPTAGVAILSTTGLLPGTHHIYALYSGDDNYAPATSAVMMLSLSDFGISITPSNLTIAQGKTQQVSALVNASGGFTGSVSLGCVPPASSQTTCSFSPSAVSGGQSATLTITTAAPSSALSQPQRSRLWPVASAASLALVFILVSPIRSRRLPTLLTFLFAAALSLSSLGCGMGATGTTSTPGQGNSGSSGNGSGTTAGNSGTPLGTQNFTITAAASDGVNTVRHTLRYQVTVQ